MNTTCEKVFVLPLEVLSIIKDFLFDYKKPFSKYVLPIIKQNYPTTIFRTEIKTKYSYAVRTGKNIWEIMYNVPKYEKMSRKKIRNLGLNNKYVFGVDRTIHTIDRNYFLTKERRYIYVNRNTDEEDIY